MNGSSFVKIDSSSLSCNCPICQTYISFSKYYGSNNTMNNLLMPSSYCQHFEDVIFGQVGNAFALFVE
jgi:hypothetical protein